MPNAELLSFCVQTCNLLRRPATTQVAGETDRVPLAVVRVRPRKRRSTTMNISIKSTLGLVCVAGAILLLASGCREHKNRHLGYGRRRPLYVSAPRRVQSSPGRHNSVIVIRRHQDDDRGRDVRHQRQREPRNIRWKNDKARARKPSASFSRSAPSRRSDSRKALRRRHR